MHYERHLREAHRNGRGAVGLAFIGRGFDVKVSAPFGRKVEEGLQKVAAECVKHCPTGALVFRNGKPGAAATES